MNKIGKNRTESDSYTAREAAAILGVSIPTLKQMVAQGSVESFRTPGGHLRILAESVEAAREQRPMRTRPVRDASPVLQNRRERLEELTLEAQELRAKREIEKLRREEAEEAEQLEAEAEEREREAAERQEALELEQARLDSEQAQQEARNEAEGRLAAFRSRWLKVTADLLAAPSVRWLSAVERKEVLDVLEVEIARRQPQDEPRMTQIIANTIVIVVERLTAERQARERRKQIADTALCELSCWATDAERAQAAAAIRESLSRLPADAQEFEVRAAAQEAVKPVCHTVKKRLLDERLIAWAVRELPWGIEDRDKARIRRECAEIVAELPPDVSEAEAKAALEPTVTEAHQEVESRQAQKERRAKKARLVEQGVGEVQSYMLQLEREGEITSHENSDSEFADQLKAAVRRTLEAKLSGDETTKAVEKRVHEIIDGKLG